MLCHYEVDYRQEELLCLVLRPYENRKLDLDVLLDLVIDHSSYDDRNGVTNIDNTLYLNSIERFFPLLLYFSPFNNVTIC